MKPNTVGRVSGQPTAQSPHEVQGLRADSIILTMEGEKYLHEVQSGDRVITRDTGMAMVTCVRSQTVTARAVRILAGSLGNTRPDRDMILPAWQFVLVRDWRARAMFGARQAIVAVHRLIDGEFIIDEGTQELTLYRLGFDHPHVLYVDGLEVASDAPPEEATRTAQDAA